MGPNRTPFGPVGSNGIHAMCQEYIKLKDMEPENIEGLDLFLFLALRFTVKSGECSTQQHMSKARLRFFRLL